MRSLSTTMLSCLFFIVMLLDVSLARMNGFERETAFIGYSERANVGGTPSVTKEAAPEPEMQYSFNNDEDARIWEEAVRKAKSNSSEPILMSKSPCVILLPNFVSYDEAEKSVESAIPRLRSQRFPDQPDSRTSWGATFGQGFAAPIIDRANQAIGTLRSDGLEVKRYREGEKYQSHHDYFSSPKNPMKGDRVATFLVYLRSAEIGGETMFPWRGGTEPVDPHTGWPYRPLDYSHECEPQYMPENALKLPVMKGSAVLFYSLTPDGEVDPYSQHGSCPVTKGEKWTATIWTRAGNRFAKDEQWKTNHHLKLCYPELDLGDWKE